MIIDRIGDATLPPERPACIFHVVNDVGAWGRGFSGALGRRYPWAERAYRVWARGAWNAGPPFALGHAFVTHGEDVAVAHLCAQHGLGRWRHPLVLSELRAALGEARAHVELHYPNASWHMPRIGSGLGGGSWLHEVRPVVEEVLGDREVFVYELEPT